MSLISGIEPSPHRDPAELAAWVRLAGEPGLGLALAYKLLRDIGPPSAIYSAGLAALTAHVGDPLARQMAQPLSAERAAQVAHACAWADADRHHVVTLEHPAYPRALLATADPPLLLYVDGDIEALARPALAIVGARNATPGGQDNAHAYARHLAAAGWCILSGLARGIDRAAHEGALAAGGRGGGTVAVMGTGIDLVYPAGHEDLARRIAAGGALVSELPFGTPPMPWQFPRRNRLVAGMARGVLVVEAARRSGSLITARLAAECGREVFAIPGSIHSPLSRGCHALIRQGAKLVETAVDISDEMGVWRAQAGPGHRAGERDSRGRGQGDDQTADGGPAAGGGAEAVPGGHSSADGGVMAALGHDPVGLDALVRLTGLDTAALHARLLQLELSGAVDRLPGARFQRRGGG
jgi:DNA processing protein